MKLLIQTSEITNPTLIHLQEWLHAIDKNLRNEIVFESLEDLATNLEKWRSEFCKGNIIYHWGDRVLITIYSDKVILIIDQRSNEFIKIEKIRENNLKETIPGIQNSNPKNYAKN
jgi:hypothetical protein